MRRRAFILSGVGVAAGVATWQFVRMNDPAVIEMVVRRRLDYLTLDSEGLRRFAGDLAGLRVISRAKMRVLSGISALYTRVELSSGHNGPAYSLRHGEDRIVSSYLISSDFFINGSDESRVVRYLGLLDPLKACGNPFARRMASS